jgi:hypothetical protein
MFNSPHFSRFELLLTCKAVARPSYSFSSPRRQVLMPRMAAYNCVQEGFKEFVHCS